MAKRIQHTITRRDENGNQTVVHVYHTDGVVLTREQAARLRRQRNRANSNLNSYAAERANYEEEVRRRNGW